MVNYLTQPLSRAFDADIARKASQRYWSDGDARDLEPAGRQDERTRTARGGLGRLFARAPVARLRGGAQGRRQDPTSRRGGGPRARQRRAGPRRGGRRAGRG